MIYLPLNDLNATRCKIVKTERGYYGITIYGTVKTIKSNNNHIYHVLFDGMGYDFEMLCDVFEGNLGIKFDDKYINSIENIKEFVIIT